MNDTSFDLGSVAVSDVAKLTIMHPKTSEPTTWVLELAGPGHPETVAISEEAQRERLVTEREQNQARINGKKWKAGDVDPEADRTRMLRRVSRRILGWSAVTMNGAPFTPSRENALKLLADPQYFWVATQVFDFLAEDAAFIGASATN